jgi:hypothetical protein
MRAEISGSIAGALASGILANTSGAFEIHIDVIGEEVILASGGVWFAAPARVTDATNGSVTFIVPQALICEMSRATETVVVTDDHVVFDTVRWTRND